MTVTAKKLPGNSGTGTWLYVTFYSVFD